MKSGWKCHGFQRGTWAGTTGSFQITESPEGKDKMAFEKYPNELFVTMTIATRFPFLDEDVVSFLNGLKLSDKMDLDLPRGVGEKLLLRGVAHKLGYRQTATNAKRAIQFGSRIAKMENRKEKATDIAHRSSN